MRWQAHVREFLVHELRRIRVALADQAGIQPLPRDSFELAEKMKLGLFARVAPVLVKQSLVRWKSSVDCRTSLEVLQIQIDRLADDSFVARDRRTDRFRA